MNRVSTLHRPRHFAVRGLLTLSLMTTGLVVASSQFADASALDGTGTLTTPTSAVAYGSTGHTITFTYTAASGGITGGEVGVTVATGWSTPSMSSAAAGFATTSAGTLTISGNTILVSGLTLSSKKTVTIVYGSMSKKGPGATASTTIGSASWTAMEKSTVNGLLTHLTTSPSIVVNRTLSAPAPPRVTVLSPTSLLVTFNADANATSSDVTVYSDKNKAIVKTVTGNTSGSETITGLVAGDTYFVAITSVGNGSTYLTSPLGAHSVSLTLGVLTITARNLLLSLGQAVKPTSAVLGLTPGDTAVVSKVVYTFSGTGTTSYATTSTPPTAIGTYAIVPSSATIVISPSTDQNAYGKSFNYVAGSLTVVAAPRVVLHATKVTPNVWTGRTVVVSILGTGFYGQPRIVSSTGRGTSAKVIRDTGTRLTVRVSVRASTPRGVHTFKIILSNGTACNIRYNQF